MTGDLLAIGAGALFLAVAADRFVVAAARISRAWGLSPVLVGAVLVGLGTSLPEMLVSGIAAAGPGGLDLAAGNVVGSNIANLSLVLGLAILIHPIRHVIVVLRREGALMAVASAGFAVAVWDGELTRLDGIVLLAAALPATWMVTMWSRGDTTAQVITGEATRTRHARLPGAGKEAAVAVVALAVTLVGAQLLVNGAKGVADALGWSAGFVGFTIVAAGTSLPEVATAVAAARRREGELILGNVLGSNLMNALLVGGMAAVIGGGDLAASFRPGAATMLVVSALAGVLALTRDHLERWEGAILLVAYPAALALSGL